MTFSPNLASIQGNAQCTVAAILTTALGEIGEDVVTFPTSKQLDQHLATLVKSSKVAKSPKWSGMQEFAKDLTDTNLESTIIDDIKRNLWEGLNLLYGYIKQLETPQLNQNEPLVFFAYKQDQESAPDVSYYRLFVLNELARLIEANLSIFQGLNTKSVILMTLNRMIENNTLNDLTRSCFNLLISLKCTLAEVAENYCQVWDEDHNEWVSD